MSFPDMQRILQTCLKHEAEEVLLMTDGRRCCGLWTAFVEPLTAQDVVSLVIDSLVPLIKDRDVIREWFDKEGFYRFDYPYRHRPDTRFRIFLIKHGEANLATLRPIRPDVPELEYADEPRKAEAIWVDLDRLA
jgi:hypothetical protein